MVSLSTASDEATRAWWPHDFHLTHRLTIGEELTQELVVSNTGNTALRFEEALHTYYRVGGAEAVRVQGLDGVAYLDNTDGNRKKQQEGDVVFTGQTDSAYIDTTHAVEIYDPLLRRRIRLAKQNSRTTVVWNPWSTGAQPWQTWGRRMAGDGLCRGQQHPRLRRRSSPGERHTMKTIIHVAAARETLAAAQI